MGFKFLAKQAQLFCSCLMSSVDVKHALLSGKVRATFPRLGKKCILEDCSLLINETSFPLIKSAEEM